jgi:hypothetical protein
LGAIAARHLLLWLLWLLLAAERVPELKYAVVSPEAGA